MRAGTGFVLSLFAALAVSGCSEVKMQNLLGSDKPSNDNEQIPVGQNLSMPPDLELRPPAGGSDETAVASNTPPARTAPATQPADLDAVPPGEQEPQQTAMAAPGPQPAKPIQPVTQQPPQDIYVHYGISKVDAEGKPKSDRILVKELHDAQIAEKRKANPKYGTIWNIGNVFSDD